MQIPNSHTSHLNFTLTKYMKNPFSVLSTAACISFLQTSKILQNGVITSPEWQTVHRFPLSLITLSPANRHRKGELVCARKLWRE